MAATIDYSDTWDDIEHGICWDEVFITGLCQRHMCVGDGPSFRAAVEQ